MTGKLLEFAGWAVLSFIACWLFTGVGYEFGKFEARNAVAEARDEVCMDMCPAGGHHTGVTCRCYER